LPLEAPKTRQWTGSEKALRRGDIL